jgi:hypothetical protein
MSAGPRASRVVVCQAAVDRAHATPVTARSGPATDHASALHERHSSIGPCSVDFTDQAVATVASWATALHGYKGRTGPHSSANVKSQAAGATPTAGLAGPEEVARAAEVIRPLRRPRSYPHRGRRPCRRQVHRRQQGPDLCRSHRLRHARPR